MKNPKTNQYYRIIKEHQNLSNEEQKRLLKKINKNFDSFLFYAFHIPSFRKAYINLYNSKKAERNYTGSVAKLSKKYNSSIHGYNHRIQKNLSKLFNRAIRLLEQNNEEEAIEILLKTHPNHRIILNPDFLDFIHYSENTVFKKLALEQLDALRQNRELLVKSAYKMVAFLARYFWVSLNIQNIEFDDILQEGLIFMYDSTMTYDLKNKTNTKWSSYAYSKVYRSLQKYIAENSGFISIPRFKISRFSLLDRIVDLANLGYDFDKIAYEANNWLIKHKTSISKNMLFTPEEVEALILHVNIDNTSLDHVKYPKKVEISENLRLSINKVLSEILTPLEYVVILKKWNIEHVDPTLDIESYYKEFLMLSKAQISQIEESALNKLIEKRNDTELQEILEIYHEMV